MHKWQFEKYISKLGKTTVNERKSGRKCEKSWKKIYWKKKKLQSKIE